MKSPLKFLITKNFLIPLSSEPLSRRSSATTPRSQAQRRSKKWLAKVSLISALSAPYHVTDGFCLSRRIRCEGDRGALCLEKVSNDEKKILQRLRKFARGGRAIGGGKSGRETNVRRFKIYPTVEWVGAAFRKDFGWKTEATVKGWKTGAVHLRVKSL